MSNKRNYTRFYSNDVRGGEDNHQQRNVVIDKHDSVSLDPLQVKISSPTREAFERGIKIFRSKVQKEKILTFYKLKQTYEKPSVKKKRKHAEARKKLLEFEAKEKLIASGKYEEMMEKKQALKDKRKEDRNKSQNGTTDNWYE